MLILVFLAELTAGIVGYVYIRQVKEGIGRGMNSSMVHYGAGGMSDETVDFVQNNVCIASKERLSGCGRGRTPDGADPVEI